MHVLYRNALMSVRFSRRETLSCCIKIIQNHKPPDAPGGRENGQFMTQFGFPVVLFYSHILSEHSQSSLQDFFCRFLGFLLFPYLSVGSFTRVYCEAYFQPCLMIFLTRKNRNIFCLPNLKIIFKAGERFVRRMGK